MRNVHFPARRFIRDSVEEVTAEMPDVLAGLVRPLRPGGWLVYAGHAGGGVVHRDDWFDEVIDLDFVLQEPKDVATVFERAGLVRVLAEPNLVAESGKEASFPWYPIEVPTDAGIVGIVDQWDLG